jgi:hypothetical protein
MSKGVNEMDVVDLKNYRHCFVSEKAMLVVAADLARREVYWNIGGHLFRVDPLTPGQMCLFDLDERFEPSEVLVTDEDGVPFVAVCRGRSGEFYLAIRWQLDWFGDRQYYMQLIDEKEIAAMKTVDSVLDDVMSRGDMWLVSVAVDDRNRIDLDAEANREIDDVWFRQNSDRLSAKFTDLRSKVAS